MIVVCIDIDCLVVMVVCIIPICLGLFRYMCWALEKARDNNVQWRL